MDCQDVVFLPCGARFYTTFLKSCGGGKSLRTTTHLKTVVGGKQEHAPCKVLSPKQIVFIASFKSRGDYKTVTELRLIYPISIFGTLENLRWLCLSVLLLHLFSYSSCNVDYFVAIGNVHYVMILLSVLNCFLCELLVI